MKRKRLISAVIAAAFVLFVPLISSAQVFTIEGNNFRDANGDLIVGIWGDAMPIVDYETGDEIYVPLSNGLWLLAAAAGLYLLAKKKNSRKATMVLAAATVLTLGMTQCRKTTENEVVTQDGKTIFISLTADNGQAKSDINMYNGRITWEKGDKVYAICTNALPEPVLLKDYLTAETGGDKEANISGKVTFPEHYTLPTEETPLFKFFYVGDGVSFNPDGLDGEGNMVFNIKNQDGINSGDYMIGCTEPVEMKVKEGTEADYEPVQEGAKTFKPLTAVLRLDLLDLCTPGEDIVLSAAKVRNTMKINVGTQEISYEESPATINFKGSGDARVSVMEAVKGANDTVRLNFKSVDSKRDGSIGIKNGIQRGKIYVDVVNNWSYPIHVAEEIIGALTGEFSVSPTQKVRFSKGNLQYQPSSNTWKFADHQWDLFHTETEEVDVEDEYTSTYSGWIDHFCWGTSGYNHGANCWRPWEVETSVDYNAYGDKTKNLNDEDGKADWGYNAISNGGNTENSGWRTLTGCSSSANPENPEGEWGYLFFGRDNYEQLYGKGKIEGINGIILLPDNWEWTGDVEEFQARWDFTHQPKNPLYQFNEYTEEQWIKMEDAGAVFLPAGGKSIRSSSSGRVRINQQLTLAYYFSTTANPTYDGRCGTVHLDHIDSYECSVQIAGSNYRHWGACIRLVKNVK